MFSAGFRTPAGNRLFRVNGHLRYIQGGKRMKKHEHGAVGEGEKNFKTENREQT